MKITALLVISLFMTSLLNAQQSNDFETNLNLDITIDTSLMDNIWTIGTPAKIKFKKAHSVPNAIFTASSITYPENNYSIFQFTVDQTGFWMFPNVVITFQHKMDMEFRRDGGWIEASYDNGMTWRNVFTDSVYRPMVLLDPPGLAPDTLYTGEIAFTGMQDNFHPVTLCWGNGEGNPPIPNVDSLHIRFVFRSDSIPSGHEGWMLDNFDVYGTIIDAIGEQPKTQNGFLVYPNPATDAITVIFANEWKGRVDIFDSQSKIVRSIRCHTDHLVIDTADLSQGQHTILFTGPDGSIHSGRFLIIE